MSAKSMPAASTRAFHRLLRVKPMRRIDMVRKGLPASGVQAAADYLAMSQKDLLSAIRIPISTLSLRTRTRKPLFPDESDKLIRLAEVVKRAMEVFGDDDEGKAWMNEPIVSLADRRPVDLLDTQDGFDLVMRTLGRIQFGAGVMRVWRIAASVPGAYSAEDLSGEGARRHGARWNSVGMSAIYAAFTVSTAVLENWAHLGGRKPPRDRYLVAIDIPDRLFNDRRHGVRRVKRMDEQSIRANRQETLGWEAPARR